jgi:hypothetical protein
VRALLPSRLSPGALATGDAVAVSLFAVAGLLSHDEGITVAGIARNALPVLAGYLGAALLVGTYRRTGLGTLLAAWATGVPAGVLLRALVLGRDLDSDQLAFGLVTMAATLVLLLAWRLLASRVPGAVPPSHSADGG